MAKINKREIEKQKRDEEDLEILCLIFKKVCIKRVNLHFLVSSLTDHL
jgi:hypothetical protein